MNYSSITTLSDFSDRCCGEQKFRTPCCDETLCLFCEDSCEECGDEIVWSA